LLASLGINGCAINNVNADPRVLTPELLPQLARVAAAFRPWGVRLALSVNFASPKRVGGLDTFDPLDPRVAEWWKGKADEIYGAIPDFAGFVVKADSEGQAGPSSYQRTHADAANVIARALKPHGGLVFYRGFVYERRYDPSNPRNERAQAAYDNFHPLDGKFDDNVIIQIKNGPIDFQVREPVSPLFSGLEKTNEAIELQITQEYTGQQRHLCFLAPMWKEVLDFDLHVEPQTKNTTGPQPPSAAFAQPLENSRENNQSQVKNLVSGKTFHRPTGGFVGVSNVGSGRTWLGHPLAMANLYAFGRLAWNPDLSSKQIAEEWTVLTFGSDPLVRRTIVDMQLGSWRTFEEYSMSLGAGSMTNIADGNHYGPGIPILPLSPGQTRPAAPAAIGRDRSLSTGTGYAGQYPPAVASLYKSADSTPDELLLFFHRVPYTHVLHSGKTVIQQIYDSHYEGAERAQHYVEQWKSLKGHIDDDRYGTVLARLEYQAGHARVWRDAICNWFLRMSVIADAKGRVGHYPDRIEAEAMELHGYVPLDVVPAETASGGEAVECPRPAQSCAAVFHFQQSSGWYDLDVQYFDQNNGASRFRIFVGNQVVDEWVADEHLPSVKVGGDTSVRRRILGLALRPGDEIRIEGSPDQSERAVIDYIELHSAAGQSAGAVTKPWPRPGRQ
jgi:alpha-glucuronidase